MKIMSFLAGAFAGAVVGATAALLLAPAPGDQLQAQARQRYDRLIEDARQAALDTQAQLRAQLEALKASRTVAGNQ